MPQFGENSNVSRYSLWRGIRDKIVSESKHYCVITVNCIVLDRQAMDRTG